jgi:hypothetical protein
MTSRLLWRLLLAERSPFPLFIRIAPRAHQPSKSSLWPFLSAYTYIGLYLSLFAAPFMFRSITLGILLVVFGSPAFITVLMAVVGLPFVLLGGIFFGLRTATRISGELSILNNEAMTDLIQVAPPGRWGLIRAVSAAYLRQRGVFFGAGVYEMINAHLALSIGLAVPGGFILSGYGVLPWLQISGFAASTPNLPPELLIGAFVGAGLYTVVLIGLLHADFRQMLMFGATAGVFGGTVTLQRFDAQTGMLGAFLLSSIVGAGIIVLIVSTALTFSPPLWDNITATVSTLVGWGLTLIVREQLIHLMWNQIIASEDIDLLSITGS